jgi:hypothetical protein
VEVTVTHTLSAHFVEVAVPSTVHFEHDGVSVRVAAAINPDAAFATITCAGTSDIADGAQLSDAGGAIGVLSDALIMLPDPHDQHYAPAVAAACHRIEDVLRYVASVLRWRFGVHGHDAVFKDTVVTALLADGRPLGLQLVPRAAMGDDRSQIEPGGLAAVADLVASSQREPVAHELWRESWNLRHANPRSSLVIGVAAAEVGLKQLIAALVPDAASLVENIPSPPLDVMMRKVLPTLPIRADVGPGRRAPRHLRTAITTAVEDRNRVVHLGATPRGDLRGTLLAIREFLYLLDRYSGQPWADAMLTQTTRSALAEPQEPVRG